MASNGNTGNCMTDHGMRENVNANRQRSALQPTSHDRRFQCDYTGREHRTNVVIGPSSNIEGAGMNSHESRHPATSEWYTRDEYMQLQHQLNETIQDKMRAEGMVTVLQEQLSFREQHIKHLSDVMPQVHKLREDNEISLKRAVYAEQEVLDARIEGITKLFNYVISQVDRTLSNMSKYLTSIAADNKSLPELKENQREWQHVKDVLLAEMSCNVDMLKFWKTKVSSDEPLSCLGPLEYPELPNIPVNFLDVILERHATEQMQTVRAIGATGFTHQSQHDIYEPKFGSHSVMKTGIEKAFVRPMLAMHTPAHQQQHMFHAHDHMTFESLDERPQEEGISTVVSNSHQITLSSVVSTSLPTSATNTPSFSTSFAAGSRHIVKSRYPAERDANTSTNTPCQTDEQYAGDHDMLLSYLHRFHQTKSREEIVELLNQVRANHNGVLNGLSANDLRWEIQELVDVQVIYSNNVLENDNRSGF